ncbi:ComEC/Rec2 family competence protein [Alphaproteobacteria bacterium KMM 3653]|uniref:ComEC/Rec2 family competence protein n=1 Tax=Harenicola maris TaxID=2841044 RepID=A0AAP2G2W7_9RHOB|nr:ComEC/Rec2 family competence protein [Harenicola maris]
MLAQTGRWLLWAPVAMAIGVGWYFALGVEPSNMVLTFLGIAALVAVVGARWLPEAAVPLAVGAALVALGVVLAAARSHGVSHPVLTFRYYGPIEGRVVAIDRSASGAVRLTLDGVWLQDTAPARMPRRVRVSLHGDAPQAAPVPGQHVMLTGHLSPPAGPVEPGGFDFRRHAWFLRLGAIGYTRSPVMQRAPPEGGGALALFRFRTHVSRAVQARLEGDTGAFAAAILTGDRAAISPGAMEDLRRSNLAHLLAISGMHMGMLTGVVLGMLRLGFALWPRVGLRIPGKKLAALGALAGAAAYLAMSGGAVSTQRAFTMVAVMLFAVLLGRRAISLRAVALAALVLLVFTPEALFGPGFQMSFSATVGLVAVFGWLRDRAQARGRPSAAPVWLRWVGALVVSSAVAGAATAPFAAAHFNRIADYGLIANLLSVPVMGALVMPGAVASAVLAPLGLEGVGLWVMELGLRWILAVAHWVAGMEGSVTWVVSPPGWVLPCLALGALWGMLWVGHLRWLGALGPVLALIGWIGAERPAVLISDTGGLVGVMGPQGRVLSKPRGDGFSARSWLENDGDGATQAEAAARAGFTGEGAQRAIDLAGGWRLRHASGKRAAAALEARCGREVIVTNQRLEQRPEGPCVVLDAAEMRARGSIALVPQENGPPQIVSARAVAGDRLWSR